MVNEGLGDELYTRLNSMLDDIATLPVSGLGWLFVWDTIRDTVMDIESFGEYQLTPEIDLKKVWDTLWETPWGGFDIEPSDVIDWLVDNDLIHEVEYDEGEDE